MKSKDESKMLSQIFEKSRISRREFLGLSAATLSGLALSSGCSSDSSLYVANNKPNQSKPNILFILTDNQPTWMLGCYGSKTVKTPNIDRLASEGMRFTRAFACNGLCSPTRATLMTGLLPSQHGIHDWLSDEFIQHNTIPPDPNWPPQKWCAVQEFRTLPVTLANRGYQTAQIGKYHMGDPTFPMPGFQYWVTFPYGHTIDFYENTIIDNDLTITLDKDHPPPQPFENDVHIVEYFAGRGVQWLHQYDGKKPFYLQLNFDGPYLLPLTNHGPDQNKYNPFYSDYVNSDFPDWPSDPLSSIYDTYLADLKCPNLENKFNCDLFSGIKDMAGAMKQSSRANTASQNAIVDNAVGRVLQALKDTGLDKNTVVIFATDQACYYGQHGWFGHTNFNTPATLDDSVLNVPFIIRYPGTITANQVSDLLIGQYDIMPTVLDIAGLGTVPIDYTPGRSFAQHLKGQSLDNWHDAIFFEQEETRGIRTSRYAYWKNKPLGDNTSPRNLPETKMLFDVLYDPWQYNNLAGNQGYTDIINELDAKLMSFFDRYAIPDFDLWHNGKTKSPTGRTATMNALYHANWQTDKTKRSQFIDNV